MTVLRKGRGEPVTILAAGDRATIAHIEEVAVGLDGTQVYFDYDSVAPWAATDRVAPAARPRREADRDADEVRAVADDHQASQAIGISRGARAVLGVLTQQADRFNRIALLLPPGGRAAGRYASWLSTLATDVSTAPPTHPEVLVIGHRGDQVHPARVAREWAEVLGARLELFPTGGPLARHHERLHALLAEFMNQPGKRQSYANA